MIQFDDRNLSMLYSMTDREMLGRCIHQNIVTLLTKLLLSSSSQIINIGHYINTKTHATMTRSHLSYIIRSSLGSIQELFLLIINCFWHMQKSVPNT